MLKRILYFIVFLFLVLQFFSPKRTNPPVTQEIQAPENVQRILQKACYDCHSNQTHWPWYSKIAPVSFLVERDVQQGRKHLNFSEMDKIPAQKLNKVFDEIAEEVEEGEMPLKIYLWLHADARLTPAEKQLLINWAKQQAFQNQPPDNQEENEENEMD